LVIKFRLVLIIPKSEDKKLGSNRIKYIKKMLENEEESLKTKLESSGGWFYIFNLPDNYLVHFIGLYFLIVDYKNSTVTWLFEHLHYLVL